MRSPSGGEARRRGGTQVSKAPPSPRTINFGLTRGQVFGEDQSATTLTFPGSAGRCGPPLRRAVSFLGSSSPKTQRKSLCAIGYSAPWPSRRQALCRNHPDKKVRNEI